MITSLIASIYLLGGLIILFLGVIGIYLSKVFSESKRRPNVIIRQTYTSAGLQASRENGKQGSE